MFSGALTRRTVLAHSAAAALLAGLTGCGDAKLALPPDPPGVTLARDDTFGDAIRTTDGQARKDVLDQLASRFGRDLRILPRSIDSDAEPGVVKAHYDKALIDARGWRDFPLADYGSAWSFAYISADSRFVVAVLALNPRFAPEGGGNVPLTIITNLPETAD